MSSAWPELTMSEQRKMLQQQEMDLVAGLQQQQEKSLSEQIDAAAAQISSHSHLTPLERSLDEWKGKESGRKEKELKALETFLWNNAPYMDADCVYTFQNLTPEGQRRVVKGLRSLADAWYPSALIRSMAGEENVKGGKKRKADAWDETPVAAPSGPLPHFYFISIPETSVLVKRGFPMSAPVMAYEKGISLFNESHAVLQEAVGDVADQVIIQDDAEAVQFPEISKAVLEASAEENCVAIALAPGSTKWATGLGFGYKGREKAVKLALAVAIAVDDPEVAARLCKLFPDFAAMWKSLTAGTSLDPGAAEAAFSTVPQVHLLQLTVDDTLIKDGLPAQGYCIAFGKHLKDMFSCATHVMQTLVDDTNSIEYIDDAEWTEMPGMGEAIKRAGAEESSFMVAVCKAKGCWAVGIAGSKKNRQNAAKLALALVIGQSSGRLYEACQYYAEFCNLCLAAGLIAPDQAAAANQQRELQEKMQEQAKMGMASGMQMGSVNYR